MPAQSTHPPVELALVHEARKERQVIISDKAQKLSLSGDPKPVLGDGECEGFAGAEERLFVGSSCQQFGRMLLVPVIDYGV